MPACWVSEYCQNVASDRECHCVFSAESARRSLRILSEFIGGDDCATPYLLPGVQISQVRPSQLCAGKTVDGFTSTFPTTNILHNMTHGAYV